MAGAPPVLSPRSTATTILHPSGADGGVEAISARRRNSGSFKHMSTGGLVSNSPFTARLGALKSPPSSPAAAAVAQRKLGGTLDASHSHHALLLESGQVKENSNPLDSKSELANAGSARSAQSSPAVPFRPIRSPNTAAAAASSTSPSIEPATSFKPTRPTFFSTPALKQLRQQTTTDAADSNRRQSSSYAALRKNGGLVSSSPFTNRSPNPAAASASAAPVATTTTTTTIPSPEMHQVPYEIGPIAHESAPFGYHDLTDELAEHDSTLPVLASSPPPSKATGSELGLGARPGSAAPQQPWSAHAARAGAHQHHATADHRRVIASGGYTAASSPFTSPNGSALSPVRRGMRGPRPMGPGEEGAEGDDGDDTEREGDVTTSSRPLRRQPSNKTVTWAETEEVLEFEVDEERRRSMMSDASSTTSDDDRRYYRDEPSSEEEEDDDGYDSDDRRRPYQAHRHADYSFQEGGSIEVHDDDDVAFGGGGSDAEDSVVSTTSSAMDDMIEQIDDFIHEESFEGQQRRQLQRDVFGDGFAHQQPQRATVSSKDADDVVSEVNSASSYDDDEEEDVGLRHARQYLLDRSRAVEGPSSPVRPQLPSPPTPKAQLAPALPIASSGMHQSDSQYSLPDIPGTSPFLGFEQGAAVETSPVAVTQPLSPRRTPISPVSSPREHQSTPTAGRNESSSAGSPILSAFDRLSIGDAAHANANATLRGDQSPQLSRKGSLVGSDVTTTSSISWYGSGVNGSLRGGTVRLGRDRLDERIKAHQALLGSTATATSPPATFGAFPTFATGPDPSRAAAASSSEPVAVGPFSQVMDHTQSAPASSALLASSGSPPPARLAIEARPASKPRSATLSSSMLPTIAASPQRTKLGFLSVGAPLTADVAEEMTSPLDRLQRGMEGRAEGAEWKSGDSLLGVADVAKYGHHGVVVVDTTGNSGTTSSDEDEESHEHATEMRKAASEPRPRRRRSRSTGDADVAETASVSRSLWASFMASADTVCGTLGPDGSPAYDA